MFVFLCSWLRVRSRRCRCAMRTTKTKREESFCSGARDSRPFPPFFCCLLFSSVERDFYSNGLFDDRLLLHSSSFAFLEEFLFFLCESEGACFVHSFHSRSPVRVRDRLFSARALVRKSKQSPSLTYKK